MKLLRIGTFATSVLVSLAIAFWPPLLYGDGAIPTHGVTSVILLGLCAGIVLGSGILQETPRQLQWSCATVAWLAIAAVVWLSA